MRLLLTRSVADAARTREKLEALGHRVIISPVIDTVGTGATWPVGVVDAVFASSAQAFLVVPIGGLSPEARRLMPLFVVGNRTLEAARAAGFLGRSRVAPTAAALADAIGSLARQPRWIYLAGRARKPDLEAALAGLNHPLDVIEVYDARAIETFDPETATAFRQDAIDGVLHFSRRSADIFLALGQEAGVDVRRPAHFCLSDDVARPLREAVCPIVQVARAPNEAELLALVDTSKSEKALGTA